MVARHSIFDIAIETDKFKLAYFLKSINVINPTIDKITEIT